VYFKAQWLQPFSSEDTEMGKFHISRNEEVDVPMMHMKTFFKFKHVDGLDAKVLELPYEVFRLCINESKLQRKFITANSYVDISCFEIIFLYLNTSLVLFFSTVKIGTVVG
jgi:hypothetical protein